MSSKNNTNKCLLLIGRYGYSGMERKALSSRSALHQQISEALSGLPIEEVNKVLRNLTRQKLVSVEPEGRAGYFRITITPAGAYRLVQMEIANITIEHVDSWDEIWRVVSYDMPSAKKQERYQLTKHLKRLRFYQLQGSMWVHPFDCREAISAIADMLGVTRYISVADVSRFDPITHSKLSKHFADVLKLHQ